MIAKPFKELSASAKWQRRKSDHFRQLGLTVKGKKRKRRPNAGNTFIRLDMRRQRGLEAWNNRVTRMRQINKTTRGRDRVYLVRRGDAILLKSQVDKFASILGKIFGLLPTRVQAQALELEKELSSIRQQII